MKNLGPAQRLALNRILERGPDAWHDGGLASRSAQRRMLARMAACGLVTPVPYYVTGKGNLAIRDGYYDADPFTKGQTVTIDDTGKVGMVIGPINNSELMLINTFDGLVCTSIDRLKVIGI